jgi:hypothetical protein
MLECVDGKEEKGKVGLGKWTKNGAVDSEHGASKGRSLLLRTKSYHSKEEGYLFTFINTAHAINIVYTLAMMYI